MALASAALGAAVALLGVTPATAVGAALLLSAALAALVARGFGPYTDFADVVARTTLWTGGVTRVLAAGVARACAASRSGTPRSSRLPSPAAAFLLELLVLLHPDMPIGDALFHAHRFQDVLGGRYYFTSIAPGNYQFPYAPGLYVFAIPFAGLVRRGVADMTLLRTIVCAADALAGLLLYGMAVAHARRPPGRSARGRDLPPHPARLRRHGGRQPDECLRAVAIGRGAGAHRPRLPFAWSTGPPWLASRSVLAAAFLSHTSTFAIGSVAAVRHRVPLLVARRARAAVAGGRRCSLAAVAAVVIAVVVYYAHFLDTYRTELTRIGGETAAAAPDAGGRGIGDRLASVPRYLNLYFGVPALAPRSLGRGDPLVARRARPRRRLPRRDGCLTCGLFLVLGILTPVDMRYYLAVGAGAGDLCGREAAASRGHRDGPSRIAALALLGWNGFRRSPCVVEYAWVNR